MKIEELIFGKWYKVPGYNGTYYCYGGPHSSVGIKMLKYYTQNTISSTDYASNSRFWEEAVLATYDDLKKILSPDDPDLLELKGNTNMFPIY